MSYILFFIFTIYSFNFFTYFFFFFLVRTHIYVKARVSMCATKVYIVLNINQERLFFIDMRVNKSVFGERFSESHEK